MILIILSNIDFIVGPPTMQAAIDSTQNPAFPFINLVLKKTNTVKKTSVEIEVNPSIYDWIVKNMGSDNIPLYFIPQPNPLNSWTPDMRISFEIMAEFGFINKYDVWCRTARETLSDFLRGKMNFKPRKNDSFTSICEELLQSCNMLEPQTRFTELLAISKNAIESKTRDPDTMIYRLAMLVFHYAFNKPPTITGIENWELAYLAFTQDKNINKKYPIIKKKLDTLSQTNQQHSFKTILSFIIGTYLYYKGVGEIETK